MHKKSIVLKLCSTNVFQVNKYMYFICDTGVYLLPFSRFISVCLSVVTSGQGWSVLPLPACPGVQYLVFSV